MAKGGRAAKPESHDGKAARTRASRVADKYIGGGSPSDQDDESTDRHLDEGYPEGAPATVKVVRIREKPQSLTAKEAAFVEEYLVDLNATQAATRAGYSEKTARQIGYENLTKPHIRAAIEAAKRDRLERTHIDADLVLHGLVADYHADIAQLFDKNGAMKPIDEWPLPFRTGLVSGMDVEEIYAGSGEDRVRIGTMLKPRFADRTALKKLLGTHIKVQAWKEKRELDVPEDSPLTQLARQLEGTAIRPQLPAPEAEDE